MDEFYACRSETPIDGFRGFEIVNSSVGLIAAEMIGSDWNGCDFMKASS